MQSQGLQAQIVELETSLASQTAAAAEQAEATDAKLKSLQARLSLSAGCRRGSGVDLSLWL